MVVTPRHIEKRVGDRSAIANKSGLWLAEWLVLLCYCLFACCLSLKWLERSFGPDVSTALPPPSTTARAHLLLPPPAPSSPHLCGGREDGEVEHEDGLRPVGRGLKRAREEGEGEDITRSRLPNHHTLPSSPSSFASSCSGFPTPVQRPFQPTPLSASSSVSRSHSSPSPPSSNHGSSRHPHQEEEAAHALSRLREWQRLSYSKSSQVLGGEGGRPSPHAPTARRGGRRHEHEQYSPTSSGLTGGLQSSSVLRGQIPSSRHTSFHSKDGVEQLCDMPRSLGPR